MVDRPSDAAAERRSKEPTDRRLVPVSGGFRLERRRSDTIELAVSEDGWRLTGPDALDGGSLTRDTDCGGFVLRHPDGVEAGRTMRTDGTAIGEGSSYLIVEDGRLFRIVLRGPRDARFELLGWETSGAYIVARPGSNDWMLCHTAAGKNLKDNDSMMILFAAEILAADEGFGDA